MIERKKTYAIWNAMIGRCYNKKSKAYKTYGAKGVTVCEEWKLFSNFERWYNENYIEGYHIDKDFGGGMLYSPETCRFISQRDNTIEALSRRDNSYLKCGQNKREVDSYEIKPTRRDTFKISCIKKGWDFNDFDEIFYGWKMRPSGERDRIYLYKKIQKNGGDK